MFIVTSTLLSAKVTHSLNWIILCVRQELHHLLSLALPSPTPDEEKKINLNRAFIKPFEAPRRSVKIKIKFIFILIQLSEMRRAGRVNHRFAQLNHFSPMFQFYTPWKNPWKGFLTFSGGHRNEHLAKMKCHKIEAYFRNGFRLLWSSVFLISGNRVFITAGPLSMSCSSRRHCSESWKYAPEAWTNSCAIM